MDIIQRNAYVWESDKIVRSSDEVIASSDDVLTGEEWLLLLFGNSMQLYFNTDTATAKFADKDSATVIMKVVD